MAVIHQWIFQLCLISLSLRNKVPQNSRGVDEVVKSNDKACTLRLRLDGLVISLWCFFCFMSFCGDIGYGVGDCLVLSIAFIKVLLPAIKSTYNVTRKKQWINSIYRVNFYTENKRKC